VTVTFNNTASWADLNSDVKNYFTETPPSPVVSYVFNP
jgi:hypothetical protein